MKPATITALRERLGLTQAEFGAVLGAHYMTVSRWERGTLEPTRYQLQHMAVFRRAEAAARNTLLMRHVAALVRGGDITAALTHLYHLAK